MGVAIVFDSLLVTTTERLIVIRRVDKKELPHLTIALKNASGEIDLHLKNESANSATQQYTPLLKVPKAWIEEYLENLSVPFEREFRLLFSRIKRVQPRSLTRRGYFVALIHNEPFRSAIIETAPKRRGKYRVDSEAVKRLFVDVDPSMISVLHPSALFSDDLKNWNEPIFAARGRGRDRLIALKYVRLNHSTYSWIRVDSIGKELPSLLERIISPEIKKEIKACWHRIHEAMQLHELGIARD